MKDWEKFATIEVDNKQAIDLSLLKFFAIGNTIYYIADKAKELNQLPSLKAMQAYGKSRFYYYVFNIVTK